ncbi:hypothetical protein HYF16_003842 [Salmonella enterica]|nr:hypothetical protein [Salmonella enterica]
MKKFMIPFYFTLFVFSSHSSAMPPDNTAAVIRKNALNVAPHLTARVTDNTPYTLKTDNGRVVIPAGKTLAMPENEARNVIIHMVNYNGLQEARRIKSDGDTFILE